MALRPTTPHDLSVHSITDSLAVCPSSSIVSDAWDGGRRLWLSAREREMSVLAQTQEVCLGNLRRGRETKFATKDRQQFLEPPSIAWLNPESLIPHEPTSPTHLEKLVQYLKGLDDDTLMPTIIVTRSAPHVILDGHHRWKSSLALGIERVPCWVVDDTLADAHNQVFLPVPPSQFRNATELAELFMGVRTPPSAALPSGLLAGDIDDDEEDGETGETFAQLAHDLATVAGDVPGLLETPRSLWRPARAYVEQYEYYKIRVYDTRTFQMLQVREIAARARAAWSAARAAGGGGDQCPGDLGWGIKGTKHVAIKVPWPAPRPAKPQLPWAFPAACAAANASSASVKVADASPTLQGDELRLEAVAPRVEWGLWHRAGEPFRAARGSIDVSKVRSLKGLDEVGITLIRDDIWTEEDS